MYVVKLWRGDHWESWGSAANPKIINQYLDLLRLLHPRLPVMVDTSEV